MPDFVSFCGARVKLSGCLYSAGGPWSDRRPPGIGVWNGFGVE